MRITSLLFLILINLTLLAQDEKKIDTTVSLNLLTSPSSPASVLLGMNPSDIQKPTDVPGIWTSIRNTTQNFTSFPNSFAIDLAPRWIFNKKSVSSEEFIKGKKSVANTLNISYAQSSQEDNYYRGLKQALGVSFYIKRPEIKDEHYTNTIESIRNILKELTNAHVSKLKDLQDNNSTYKSLKESLKNADPSNRATIIAKLEVMEQDFTSQAKQYVSQLPASRERIEKLKELEKTILPVRKGFYMSMAAGTMIKYDNFKASHASATNKSIWLNIGFDGLGSNDKGEPYFSVLALSRFIFDNADELYKSGSLNQFNTWDNGLRFAYTSGNQVFTISGEAISRKISGESIGDDFVWKYLANVDIQVGKNKKLSFSYGKDFNNHINKDGNVIGYLNFITSLYNAIKFD